MDSNSLYKAIGSTSSRVPSGSCCLPLMRFAFTQANPACPAVSMSHWFWRQFLVLNDIHLNISLFNFNNICALISRPERLDAYLAGTNTRAHTADRQALSVHISHDLSACSSNISSPFFTPASFCFPSLRKAVSAGLYTKS